jgi:hypothetical protein
LALGVPVLAAVVLVHAVVVEVVEGRDDVAGIVVVAAYRTVLGHRLLVVLARIAGRIVADRDLVGALLRLLPAAARARADR